MRFLPALTLAVTVLASACTSSDAPADGATTTTGAPGEIPELPVGTERDFGPAPEPPDGPLEPEVVAAVEAYLEPLVFGGVGSNIDDIVASGDVRLAWLLADLLRFFQGDATGNSLTDGLETLTGIEVDDSNPWGSATDHLIAWDTPAPPDYLRFKRTLFLAVEPRWEPLFADPPAGEPERIDWRHVSWGGVLIDDRPFGDDTRCDRGCIPAIDDPVVTPAAQGDWYPDDAIVFGVEVNGETRAYPKNQMEVHEMINDTLGGRRLGIPYCTLCGSAQAWFTDGSDPSSAAGPLLLRTSGLLIRSNKMMFDLTTFSFIDTFTGVATSGPLSADGIELDQASVVTTTWGAWKADNPDTTILAEDGGLGRTYSLDPLQGRDDNGPIFPIGNVDPRLPVQEPVLGIFGQSGTPIAVHVATAIATLERGDSVIVDGITIELDGGGLRAIDADGNDVGGHQSFWFAWSQFHPETLLWPTDGG